ncbi:MAG: septum formation initiator family protein, partial [Desulfosarcinaceae bacterium]
VELNRLHRIHDGLVETNAGLTKENTQLYRAIDRLQNDRAFVEAVARRELGMVHSGEMIFKFKTSKKAQ